MKAPTERLSFMGRTKALMRATPTDLDPATKLVLWVLFAHAHDDGGGIYAGASALCEMAGMPRRTLFRHLQILTDRGYLLADGFKQHGRGCRTALRRLDLAALARDRASGNPLENDADIEAEAGDVPAGRSATPSAMHGTPPCAMGGTTPSATHGTQTKRDNQKGEPSERARARRPPGNSKFPEDWRPDAKDVQFALDAGITDPMPVAAKFSAWHRAEGTERADWRAAWQRWCLDEPRFQDAGGRRRPAREKYRNGFLGMIEDEGMPSMAEGADDDDSGNCMSRLFQRMTGGGAAA